MRFTPRTSLKVLAATVVAAASFGAFAQTTGGTAAPTNPNAQPAAVGTTPSTAAEAQQRAVPRSDTGTVVRTGPGPADAARNAAANTRAATSNAATAVTNAVTPNTTTGTTTNTTTTTGGGDTSGMRAARADRN